MFELDVSSLQLPLWQLNGMHPCNTSSIMPGTVSSARQPFHNHEISWITHLVAHPGCSEKPREYAICGYNTLKSA